MSVSTLKSLLLPFVFDAVLSFHLAQWSILIWGSCSPWPLRRYGFSHPCILLSFFYHARDATFHVFRLVWMEVTRYHWTSLRPAAQLSAPAHLSLCLAAWSRITRLRLDMKCAIVE